MPCTAWRAKWHPRSGAGKWKSACRNWWRRAISGSSATPWCGRFFIRRECWWRGRTGSEWTSSSRAAKGGRARPLRQTVGIHAIIRFAKQDEGDLVQHRVWHIQVAGDLAQSDGSSIANRVPVDAGADGGEGDGGNSPLFRQLEARAVTGRQQVRLAVFTVAVDRADGVKYEARGELTGRGYDSTSGGTSAGFRANLIE